jgi:hypothetical protein
MRAAAQLLLGRSQAKLSQAALTMESLDMDMVMLVPGTSMVMFMVSMLPCDMAEV